MLSLRITKRSWNQFPGNNPSTRNTKSLDNKISPPALRQRSVHFTGRKNMVWERVKPKTQVFNFDEAPNIPVKYHRASLSYFLSGAGRQGRHWRGLTNHSSAPAARDQWETGTGVTRPALGSQSRGVRTQELAGTRGWLWSLVRASRRLGTLGHRQSLHMTINIIGPRLVQIGQVRSPRIKLGLFVFVDTAAAARHSGDSLMIRWCSEHWFMMIIVKRERLLLYWPLYIVPRCTPHLVCNLVMLLSPLIDILLGPAAVPSSGY